MPSSTVNICVFALVLLSIQHTCYSRPQNRNRREIVKDYFHPLILPTEEFEKGEDGKFYLKKSAHKLDSAVNYVNVEDESSILKNDLKSSNVESIKDEIDAVLVEEAKNVPLNEMASDTENTEKVNIEVSSSPPHFEEVKIVKEATFPKSEAINVEKIEISEEKAPFEPVDSKSIVPSKPDSKDEIAIKTEIPVEEEKVDKKVTIGQVPHFLSRIIPIPTNFRIPILIPIRKISYGSVSVVPLPSSEVSDRLPLPYQPAEVSDRLPLPPPDVSDRILPYALDDIVGEGEHESASLESAAEVKKEAQYPVANPLSFRVQLPLLSFSGLLKDLKDTKNEDGEKQSKIVDVLGKKFLMQTNVVKYPSGDNSQTFVRFMSVKPLESKEPGLSKEITAEEGIKSVIKEISRKEMEEIDMKKKELKEIDMKKKELEEIDAMNKDISMRKDIEAIDMKEEEIDMKKEMVGIDMKKEEIDMKKEMEEIDWKKRAMEEIDMNKKAMEEIDMNKKEISEIDMKKKEISEIDIKKREMEEIDMKKKEMEEIDMKKKEMEEIDMKKKEMEENDMKKKEMEENDMKKKETETIYTEIKEMEENDMKKKETEKIDMEIKEIEDINMKKKEVGVIDSEKKGFEAFDMKREGIEAESGILIADEKLVNIVKGNEAALVKEPEILKVEESQISVKIDPLVPKDIAMKEIGNPEMVENKPEDPFVKEMKMKKESESDIFEKSLKSAEKEEIEKVKVMEGEKIVTEERNLEGAFKKEMKKEMEVVSKEELFFEENKKKIKVEEEDVVNHKKKIEKKKKKKCKCEEEDSDSDDD